MSYGMGYSVGSAVEAQAQGEIDREQLMAGLRDALEGRERRVSQEDFQAALATVREAAEEQAAKVAEKNLGEAQAFLESNAAREAVTVTDSGLQYEVLASAAGDNASPAPEDRVVVHYTGELADGTVFDSSRERGEPAEFRLDRVIPGWTEALQRMEVGDRWKIWLPPELAYGERGAGKRIPPNSALVFDVELLDVKPAENDAGPGAEGEAPGDGAAEGSGGEAEGSSGSS